MNYPKRIYYTAEQKSLMWDLYKQGESLHTIGRMFDRGHQSVRGILSRTGGIRPPEKTRSSRVLSLDEREEISRGIVSGDSVRAIAQQLNRSPSTISREIHRHGGHAQYRAAEADKAAWNNACRPKPCKLLTNKRLRLAVTKKLKATWSPEQIAGWLKRAYPKNKDFQVSHETIYKTLYIQTRGALKKELQQYLRSQRVMRKSPHATMKNKGLGQIKDAVKISERPSCVEDRAVPGHWEGDLIAGSNNTYIATLVERHSRYVMLMKVKDSKTETVVNALIKHSQKLPREVYKSLTWDRGSEMAGHKRFTLATDIQVYFCDPQSPWQRGSNENTNRLLRDYFPKGTDLSVHSQQKLNAVARQLNERPRKTLQFESPAERFNQCVAMTD